MSTAILHTTVPFPPRDVSDVDAFMSDAASIHEGYVAFLQGEPEPGGNRTPAFRWGYANARYDGTKVDDGLVGLRHAWLRTVRED